MIPMTNPRTPNNCVLAIGGQHIALLHAIFGYGAFIGALILGLALHYHQIVKNEFFGYPEEWFPSVSATIGDWYPERSYFHVVIALTALPRFTMLLLWFLQLHDKSLVNRIIAALGLGRTFLCGGWVYVSSTDDHHWHDIFMISYLLTNIPWFFGCMAASNSGSRSQRYRKIFAALFFGSIPPLIYFFIQHKVHRIPGAYTIYAFLEWSLVLYDVGFDSSNYWDLEALQIHFVSSDATTMNKIKLDDGDDKSFKALRSVVKSSARSISILSMVDFIVQSYTAFVFWSILTSLGLVIWYFPLWNMGISGYEVLLLSNISPLLLSIRSIRRAVNLHLHWGFVVSLGGIVAAWVADPANTLLLVSLGTAAITLFWVITFHSSVRRKAQFDFNVAAFLCGLVASTVAKFAYRTNNPIWPILGKDMGSLSLYGLFIGLACAYWVFARNQGRSQEPVDPTIQDKPILPMNNCALAFGAILFMTHSMLCDSSSIILNVWEGYPIRGPMVVPHGALTIAVMSLGAYVGIKSPERAVHSGSFYLSILALFLYHNFSGWLAYIGGLLYGFFLLAITPFVLAQASSHPPHLAFGLGFLYYNLLALASVWVVAYAFVPGGPLLRERTWLLYVVVQVLIGNSILRVGKQTQRSHSRRSRSKLAEERHLTLSSLLLSILTLSSVGIAYIRFPSFSYTSYHPDSNLITAGIWTVHFALDNSMWASEARISNVLRDLELDVVGLLETDTQRIIGGFRDMTQYLSEELGMYADYGPSARKHTWGAALLSKFPIVRSTHFLLPSPDGELAPAIHATLDAYGHLVDVIVSHNGQEETPEDRRLQAMTLGTIMRESPRPFIFLGYVVSKPGHQPQTLLTADNNMKDIEPSDWDRWCEYVLYRGLRRVGYARLDRGSITDTEIQSGKFIVGSGEGEDVRVDESEIPDDYRYPAMFRGSGVGGHRYDNNEVVKEPWYYK